MQQTAAGIGLEDIHVTLGGHAILSGLNLAIGRGEFVSLLAPSGAGKSTVLNVVAGFLPIDAGRVLLHGLDVTGLPANRRNIGFIFQDFALFPHMTVAENVAFPLRIRHLPVDETRRRVAQALQMVNLLQRAERRPRELSGGQRQRVAIARAIVYQPKVLLMDEPLSSLDRALREDMTNEIKRLQRELEVTVLYVTHDQQEALALSDHIGVLASGNIAQYDTPGAVHNKPRSRYIGRLVGQLNEHALSQVSQLASGVVGGSIGEALIRAPARDDIDIKSVNFVGVRPHFVSLSKAAPDPIFCNAIVGRIEEAVLVGSGVLYTVRLPSGQQWYSKVADYYPGIEIGSEVFVMWPAEHTVLLES